MADEKLLSKIRALLDKANSTEFPAEQESLLGKAEALMQQHEIDQAMLDATRPGVQRSIVTRDFEMPRGSFVNEMGALFRIFAEMRNVRFITKYTGNSQYVRRAVGFEDDLGFVELLFTTTMMDFASKITPTWNPRSGQSPAEFDHSVRAFKEAGYKWVQIAEMANKHGGNPRTGRPGSTTDGAWLKTAYRRECVRVGVAPTRQTQRHEAFRATFASAYVSKISQRVFEMKRGFEQATGIIAGNLPAVRSSRERVDEEFYRLFPNMRPLSEEELKAQEARYQKEREEDARKREEFLASLTPSELDQFLRREERKAARQQRGWDAEDRARFDESGWDAGQKAATEVDLSGGANRLAGKRSITS